jgi:hypothetical protein
MSSTGLPPTTNYENSVEELTEMETLSEDPSLAGVVGTSPTQRSETRNKLYERFRGVFIVHVLAPSGTAGQLYDIFIYLKRHRDRPISIVKKAEFFFGSFWGNNIFEGQHEGDVIGVRVSAYGSFLCTCLVTFEDNEQVSLYRYIDFEMGDVMAELP